MFSNQYMGTKLASRSLPRPGTGTPRMSSYDSRPSPINARVPDDEGEEVDYSFMNLPVSERRKLFLGGGRPTPLRVAGVATIPRQRYSTRTMPSRYETQSEYGGGGVDEAFGWEPRGAPKWATINRATGRSTTSTGSIILSAPGGGRTYVDEVPTVATSVEIQRTAPSVNDSVFEPKSRSIGRFVQVRPNRVVVHPQFSATLKVQEPYATGPRTRVVSNANTRIYPVRHMSATAQLNGPTYLQPEYWRPVSGTSGRVAQPLRVNVYAGDVTTTRYSPPERAWSPNSPIYPAYPAYADQRYIYESPIQRERYRRAGSVQPSATYVRPSPPIAHRVETQQTWKPMQAPNWIESNRPRRQGRYISTTHQNAGMQRPEPQEVGVSDF
ncbi:unnamed protein product [Calicophoron daubneyi]|uniref:Uncharacterized protein n=1 Tax=Calicophoron daubneyi TaxID=300641 RepID=A0AAV2T0W7_CALDB